MYNLDTYEFRVRVVDDRSMWRSIPIIGPLKLAPAQVKRLAYLLSELPFVYEVRHNLENSQQGVYTPGPATARELHGNLGACRKRYNNPATTRTEQDKALTDLAGFVEQRDRILPDLQGQWTQINAIVGDFIGDPLLKMIDPQTAVKVTFGNSTMYIRPKQPTTVSDLLQNIADTTGKTVTGFTLGE